MKLSLVLSTFALVFALTPACKSVSKSDDSEISGMEVKAEAETFAMLGSRRIALAYSKMQTALASMPSEFNIAEALASSRDLIEIRDMLEIFVHIFPIRSGEDELIALHQEISEGITLLSDFAKLPDAMKIENSRPAILSYAKRMSGTNQRQKFTSYFETINKVYATRRSIPALNSTCWAKVDFIPRLTSPGEQELHDFMKALIKATRAEATDALTLEEIMAVEQATAFQGTRTKALHVLMVQSHFPEITDNDEELEKSLIVLKELSKRYEDINDMLEDREALLNDGKSSLLLDRKILKDWAETKTWQESSGKF